MHRLCLSFLPSSLHSLQQLRVCGRQQRRSTHETPRVHQQLETFAAKWAQRQAFYQISAAGVSGRRRRKVSKMLQFRGKCMKQTKKNMNSNASHSIRFLGGVEYPASEDRCGSIVIQSARGSRLGRKQA